MIKPNLTELGELLGHVPASQSEMRRAAEKLRDEYGSNVIVTMGSAGRHRCVSQRSYFVHPLSIPVESVAGAGDGVLAGMALAIFEESLEYGLLHGFALAGAILQTLPTADLEVEDYEALLLKSVWNRSGHIDFPNPSL